MLTKVVETLEKEIKGTQKMKQKKTASRAVHTALAKRTQKDTKNIVTSVRACIAPIVSSLGYELWDVEYVKEGTREKRCAYICLHRLQNLAGANS